MAIDYNIFPILYNHIMPLPIALSFKLNFERKKEREKVIKLRRLWSSARGLSPLKPILVEGVLDRSQEHVSSCRSCRGKELNN
jgi:hypothetical protein